MTHTNDGGPSAEAIAALDVKRMRRECEARQLMDELRRTVRLRPVSRIDVSENYVPEFTNESAEVMRPYLDAMDILRDIIYASDGCAGHRNCAHSMEPWQRARKLLYGEGVER